MTKGIVMTIYKCGQCDSKVKKGTNFCPECGAKLEWTEKEKNKARVKNKDRIRLPINPDRYDDLISSRFSPMSFCDDLLCLFVVGGPILKLIIWTRKRKIKKWFDRLNDEECDLSEFQQYVFTIYRCGISAIVISIISVLWITFVYALADGEINIANIVIHIISSSIATCPGLILGVCVKRFAKKVLNDLDSDKTYLYDLSDEESEDDYNESSTDDTNSSPEEYDDEF